MTANDIDYLINILHKKDIQFDKKDKDNILNNLVYYVPRIRDAPQLELLISSLFHVENVTLLNDPFQLQETVQSIFLSKLSISEPTVSISTFYKIWDSVIDNMNNRWTLSTLAMLSGILITENVYESLQNRFYMDDQRNTQKLYKKWRETYFIPIIVHTLNSFLKMSNTNKSITQNTDLIDYLVNLYSTVTYFMNFKSNNRILPWNLITESSISIIIKYMTNASKYPAFLNKRINCIALNLQNCIPHTDVKLIRQVLRDLNYQCKVLSHNQQYGDTPNISYSNRFFSNILLTLTLTFKSILTSKTNILNNENSLDKDDILIQLLESLFYLHFITLDFGIIGFQSYEIVYNILCLEIIKICNNHPSKQYFNLILQKLLRCNPRNVKYPNKVYDSKIIFILDFIKNTITAICSSNVKLAIQSVIEPIILNNTLNSPYIDIREVSHSVIIHLLSMMTTDSDVRQWQLSNILPYANQSFDQYIENLLTEEQLYIIAQRIGGYVQLLSIYKHDFQREWLHNIYRRLINLTVNSNITKIKMIQLQTTLIKCIIYQIPYINAKYLKNWLENIDELSKTLLFDKYHYSEIIDTLWDVISESKSDIAIKWWYSRKNSSVVQSYL
ncbi:hypothetical protein RI543_003289 [Arxiozyma heterogenica]|uniref:Uncharacterized protein n=1 Tax=Arxiozyma heterogenica TaxID=278026 RepID=A0AAN7WSQ5_9SACH|nr:hypothetical protein RI543_003289 [Kazachstania heterogenica]